MSLEKQSNQIRKRFLKVTGSLSWDHPFFVELLLRKMDQKEIHRIEAILKIHSAVNKFVDDPINLLEEAVKVKLLNRT